MSGNRLLKYRLSSFCELFIFILIAILAIRVNCENYPKVLISSNDSTLVYTFHNSPSIHQVLLVPKRGGLLVAGTDFIYLLENEVYRKDEKYEPGKAFLGKASFPNSTAYPVNEIKIMVPIDEDQYFVCGTINDGKCYLLNTKHPSNVLELGDKLTDVGRFNYLGYSGIRCEKQGFFQDPFNCSRFFSCFRRSYGLFRSKLKDCPYVRLEDEYTSLGNGLPTESMIPT